MTDYKPRARKGRKPRTRGGSSRGASRDASHASASRKLLKARIRALEARYSTLHSWVGELHEAVTGESVRAHPDDVLAVALAEFDAATAPSEEE